jgi:hypothetical protein
MVNSSSLQIKTLLMSLWKAIVCAYYLKRAQRLTHESIHYFAYENYSYIDEMVYCVRVIPGIDKFALDEIYAGSPWFSIADISRLSDEHIIRLFSGQDNASEIDCHKSIVECFLSYVRLYYQCTLENQPTRSLTQVTRFWRAATTFADNVGITIDNEKHTARQTLLREQSDGNNNESYVSFLQELLREWDSNNAAINPGIVTA